MQDVPQGTHAVSELGKTKWRYFDTAQRGRPCLRGDDVSESAA
ncbi:GTP-binding protein [Neisseria bacilliformis ATCC BAA-1200]|uniref:GTP-binding protein n=1 Tax=Neisseria bacilliformis ATCC BAA-1200 TaxID=888742 RepID=F2BDW2_9NEIS|nr:GTP-binding protein [Neisseria bacilliformis ATCC BAA-1200]